MPKVPEDPPRRLELECDGRTVVIADEGGDLTWRDVENLQLQRERRQMFRDEDDPDIPRRLPAEHLGAVLDVLRFFEGATIDDWFETAGMARPSTAAGGGHRTPDTEWARRDRARRRRGRQAGRAAFQRSRRRLPTPRV